MALPQISGVANLTADPELRFAASGTAIAKIRVASNERKRQPDGSFVDGTVTYLTLTVFKVRAEAAAELRKGQRVMFTGRLAQRFWDDDSGARRSDFEVLVDEMALIPKLGDTQPKGVDPWADQAASAWPDQTNEVPF